MEAEPAENPCVRRSRFATDCIAEIPRLNSRREPSSRLYFSAVSASSATFARNNKIQLNVPPSIISGTGPFRTLWPHRPCTTRRADHCGNGGEWRRYGLRHHRPIRPAPLRPQCRTGRSPAQDNHADTDGRNRIATLSVTITPPATSSRASAK